jgi:hypothetical protein
MLIMYVIGRTTRLHNRCFMLLANLAVADLCVGVSYFVLAIVRLTRLYDQLGAVMSRRQCGIELFFANFGCG